MTLKKILRLLLVSLGALVLASVGYTIYGFAGAEDRVKGICASVRPGMNLDDLVHFSETNGLLFPRSAQGKTDRLVLAEGRSMGRYGCDVSLAGGVVESVEAYHLD